MSANRNIALINLYTICCNMVFILPVIVPYYQTIGLTFRDFLLSEAVFSAVVLFAEVPSGWISDVWKRRTALIFGMVFGIAGYAGLLLSQEFWHTAVSQGIIGIAVAMNSGTVTALLYDSLLQEGRESEYRRLEGRRHAYSLYSIAFAAVTGAILFKIDPKLPLMLEIVIMLIAMVGLAFIMEPVRHTKSVERHALHDIKETVLYALRGHAEITGIILVSTVIFCATKLMMWSQQPYYTLADIPVEWFGVIMAGSYVVSGIAGHWSHRIEHVGSHRGALGFMAAMLAVSCAAIAFLPGGIWAIALFLTGTLAWGMGQPRVNAAINARVGSERRATILSTQSLMVHVLFIPSSIVVGFIADAGDIRDALLYIAMQIAVLGRIGLWLWKKA